MRQPQIRFKSGAWRAIFYNPFYRNGKLRYREEWVTLKDPKGNRITNPDSSTAANKALRYLDRERAANKLPIRGEDLTVDEACTTFLDARAGTLKDQTLRTYRAAFALLLPDFGMMRVSAMTKGDIDAYQSSLIRTGYEKSTVRSYVKAVTTLFSWLANAGLISESSAPRFRPVRPEEKKRTYLPWTDAPRLLAAVDSPEYRAGVGLAIYAGLRRGEVLALSWKNIDFEAGVIHIQNDADWSTKTGRNRETVILPDLRPLLESLPRRGPFVVLDPRHRQTKTAREQALIRAFERARDTAGFAETLRFHDLRGSFATELLQRFPPAVVQQILGHADVQTTMRYYSRIDPQRAVEIVRKTMVGDS